MPTDTSEVLPFSPLTPVASQMESLQGVQPTQSPTAEQSGTLRSNGTMPTTPATVLDNLPKQTGFGLSNDSVSTLQAIARNSATESAQHSSALASLEKLSNSGNIPTMYHVLAGLAALSGNFGPAIAIQEQKRKATIGKEMFPVMSQINRLKALGKYDEATQLAEDAASRVGPQAPEIVPILNRVATDIGTKQIQLQQEKTLFSILGDTVQKDDVNRSLVDAALKANKGGMILGAAQVGELMSKLVPHIQNVNNQNIRSSLLTGKTTSTPLPEVFDPSSLKGTVGPSVQGETGGTLDQITNTMRTGQPLIANGQVYSKDELQNIITKYQQREAKFEVMSKVPTTPQQNEWLLANGVPPERVATGNVSTVERDKANAYGAQKLKESTLATKQAPLDIPAILGDKPQVVFDKQTGEQVVQASPNDAFRNPDKLAIVDPDKHTKEILPLYRLERKLSVLNEIVPELPSINDPIARATGFVARKLNNIFNFDPRLIEENTLKTVVKSAVEEYANSKGISAARYKELTEPLTGTSVSKEGAVAVLDKLRQYITSDLDLYRNQQQRPSATNAITNTSPIPSIHSAIIKGAQQRGIDPVLALSVIAQESNYNPGAVGPGGDRGLGQFTESTARSRNLDWNRLKTDAQYNLDSSLDYLSELLKTHGPVNGIMRYNGNNPEYVKWVEKWNDNSKRILAGQQAASVIAPVVPSTSTNNKDKWQLAPR